MLVPALLYKEEIEKEFARLLYTDEYFYYQGGYYTNTIPEIAKQEFNYGLIEYAIVDTQEGLLGYLGYHIDPETDTANSIGVISFTKGNAIIGKDLFEELETLVHRHRRVEWRMYGGNPAEKHYDRFLKKHGGNKVILHDVLKDKYGKYHDEVIYEILRVEEEE